jgi:hypothetical protein
VCRRLVPTQDDLYLSCSVHDHCRNGQRLVVHVLPVRVDENGGAASGAVPFAALLGAGLVAAILIAGTVGVAICACRKRSTPIVRSLPNAAQSGMGGSSIQAANGV